jgi:hypothetical protein
MMAIDKFRHQADLRKKPRRPISYKAEILVEPGVPPRACTISDISPIGARLLLEEDGEVPDKFMLLLTANKGVQRACRLVWRDGKSMGVAFLDAAEQTDS